jgi:protocatechuate 3,4-dioxygenase beta subunit
MTLSRRRFLIALPAPLAALILACGGDESPDEASAPAATSTSAPASGSGSQAQGGAAASTPVAPSSTTAQLAPTPACGDDDDPTVAQTEGPYFTPNSPERASLVDAGMRGTKLVIEGFVVSTACQPVVRALVDFWQCDDAGAYDNTGYRLRGHQFTDASGRYRLETILPGLYTGRTRHIHVKVQAPGGRVLTTQLYFPDEAGNARDGIYSAALLLKEYGDSAGGKAGKFNFVLNT